MVGVVVIVITKHGYNVTDNDIIDSDIIHCLIVCNQIIIVCMITSEINPIDQHGMGINLLKQIIDANAKVE